MTLASAANEKIAEAINAEHRSLGHVAIGAGVCLALIAVTAALSVSGRQAPAPGAKPSRHPLVKAIWPSLFSVTTLAALRVWNAPASRERARALGFWGVLQASNLLFSALKPRSQSGQVTAALATAGLTAAYAHAASYVDPKAAALSAPTGFAGLSSVIATPAKG